MCGECLGQAWKWEAPFVPTIHMPTPRSRAAEHVVFLWAQEENLAIEWKIALLYPFYTGRPF
jgi:hypothetical protein